MAGVKLHEKIIARTKTSGRDQEHLDVIHLSRSRLIGDRTEFLLGKTERNPGIMMARVIAAAAKAVPVEGDPPRGPAVAGVPCNTFHAPPVWDAFTAALAELAPEVRTVHMLEAALGDLKAAFGHGGNTLIGILSTTGTARSGVWQKALEGAGFGVVTVNDSLQERVHDAIYNLEWGLKAVTPATAKARTLLEEAAAALVTSGAQAVLLGCTEIPLALEEGAREGVLYADPVTSLAGALVRAAGGTPTRE